MTLQMLTLVCTRCGMKYVAQMPFAFDRRCLCGGDLTTTPEKPKEPAVAES
jgi:hypothetical protein